MRYISGRAYALHVEIGDQIGGDLQVVPVAARQDQFHSLFRQADCKALADVAPGTGSDSPRQIHGTLRRFETNLCGHPISDAARV